MLRFARKSRYAAILLIGWIAQPSRFLFLHVRNATLGRMVLHFVIKGRVQGVGFRWFVQREAAEIGLRGWVRNIPEGHVELVAAGTLEQIAELRVALHKGSRGSRVDVVIEHELAGSEAEKLGPFEIEGAW